MPWLWVTQGPMWAPPPLLLCRVGQPNRFFQNLVLTPDSLCDPQVVFYPGAWMLPTTELSLPIQPLQPPPLPTGVAVTSSFIGCDLSPVTPTRWSRWTAGSRTGGVSACSGAIRRCPDQQRCTVGTWFIFAEHVDGWSQLSP